MRARTNTGCANPPVKAWRPEQSTSCAFSGSVPGARSFVRRGEEDTVDDMDVEKYSYVWQAGKGTKTGMDGGVAGGE